MLRSIRELHGCRVAAAGGEMVGHVDDLLFEDEAWGVRHLVVHVGGFLSSHRVLVPPGAIEVIDHLTTLLSLDLTREQLLHSPDLETDQPVSRQQAMAIHGQFGWAPCWTPYWSAAEAEAGAVAIVPLLEEEAESPKRPDSDPHLRSAREILGYHIQATDDEIGHVADILVDDRDCTVRQVVVDTRNWLPGPRVMMPPRWVEQISWEKQKIFVHADREHISQCPAYHPDRVLRHNDQT